MDGFGLSSGARLYSQRCGALHVMTENAIARAAGCVCSHPCWWRPQSLAAKVVSEVLDVHVALPQQPGEPKDAYIFFKRYLMHIYVIRERYYSSFRNVGTETPDLDDVAVLYSRVMEGSVTSREGVSCLCGAQNEGTAQKQNLFTAEML